MEALRHKPSSHIGVFDFLGRSQSLMPSSLIQINEPSPQVLKVEA